MLADAESALGGDRPRVARDLVVAYGLDRISKPELWFLLAQAESLIGDQDAADAALSRAVALDGGGLPVRNLKNAIQRRREEDARTRAAELVKGSDDQTSDLLSAAEILRRTCEQGAVDRRTWRSLARIEERLGRPNAALKAAIEALVRGPHDAQWQNAVARIALDADASVRAEAELTLRQVTRSSHVPIAERRLEGLCIALGHPDRRMLGWWRTAHRRRAEASFLDGLLLAFLDASEVTDDALTRREAQRVLPAALRPLVRAAETAPMAARQGFAADARPRVLGILDAPSAACFSGGLNLSLPAPDEWRDAFELLNPEMLLVESTWNANGGSWYGMLGASKLTPVVTAMVEHCRARGIPTVFWNKEDPTHFEQFSPLAPLFDWVLTTDGGSLPGYEHLRLRNPPAVMAFAAEPSIHNPIGRNRVAPLNNVCFAGAWYAAHPQRNEAVTPLLRAAVPYGLTIYDRYAELVDNTRHRFPEEFVPFIAGSLAPEAVPGAFRSHRVTINVNTVTNSPTMFARRAFESLACATPVVSNPSEAMVNLLGHDGVRYCTSEREATEAIRYFTSGEPEVHKEILRAQRGVLRDHTYASRIEQMLTTTQLRTQPVIPLVSAISATRRPTHLVTMVENIERQTWPRKELVVAINQGGELSRSQVLETAEQVAPGLAVTVVELHAQDSLGRCLNEAIGASAGAVFAKMDDDDHYGPDFLTDSLHALNYSRAECVGKERHFVYFKEEGTVWLTRGRQEDYTTFVIGPTIVAHRHIFPTCMFADRGIGEDTAFLNQISNHGGLIYAHNPYNYAKLWTSEAGFHTWDVADTKLKRGGELVGSGPPAALVDA